MRQNTSSSLPIVILGAGGHAKVILDACRGAGLTVAGLLDDGFPPGATLLDACGLGGDARLDDPAFVKRHAFIVGVGAMETRRTLIRHLDNRNAPLATVIHPSAVISPWAKIAPGTLVAAGVVVNPETRIGRHVILNTCCSVDHDCHVGENCHIGPGARLAGGVNCGEEVFVGIGASVAPGLRIAARSVVGAGATVIRDVAEGVTVVGVPAVEMEKREHHDHHHGPPHP